MKSKTAVFLLLPFLVIGFSTKLHSQVEQKALVFILNKILKDSSSICDWELKPCNTIQIISQPKQINKNYIIHRMWQYKPFEMYENQLPEISVLDRKVYNDSNSIIYSEIELIPRIDSFIVGDSMINEFEKRGIRVLLVPKDTTEKSSENNFATMSIANKVFFQDNFFVRASIKTPYLDYSTSILFRFNLDGELEKVSHGQCFEQ